MKWIIVANSSDCKIFKCDRNIHNLSLLEEIKHPENRLREHDLITDSYGFCKKPGMHRSSYEPETSHTELAMDKFAREMAGKLNRGRIKHLYDDIVLLMPPTMEGKLLKHLNKNILCMVRKKIQKNLIHMSLYELKKYLCNNLRFRGAMH